MHPPATMQTSLTAWPHPGGSATRRTVARRGGGSEALGAVRPRGAPEPHRPAPRLPQLRPSLPLAPRGPVPTIAGTDASSVGRDPFGNGGVSSARGGDSKTRQKTKTGVGCAALVLLRRRARGGRVLLRFGQPRATAPVVDRSLARASEERWGARQLHPRPRCVHHRARSGRVPWARTPQLRPPLPPRARLRGRRPLRPTSAPPERPRDSPRALAVEPRSCSSRWEKIQCRIDRVRREGGLRSPWVQTPMTG